MFDLYSVTCMHVLMWHWYWITNRWAHPRGLSPTLSPAGLPAVLCLEMKHHGLSPFHIRCLLVSSLSRSCLGTSGMRLHGFGFSSISRRHTVTINSQLLWLSHYYSCQLGFPWSLALDLCALVVVFCSVIKKFPWWVISSVNYTVGIRSCV